MRRAVRRSRRERTGGPERLEQRLVLGSLSPGQPVDQAQSCESEPRSGTEAREPLRTAGFATDGAQALSVPSRERPDRAVQPDQAARALDDRSGDQGEAPKEASKNRDPELSELADVFQADFENLLDNVDNGEDAANAADVQPVVISSGSFRPTARLVEHSTGAGRVRAPSGLVVPAGTASVELSQVDPPQAAAANPGVPTPNTDVEPQSSDPNAPWFARGGAPVEIGYDFRDVNGFANRITSEQIASAELAMAAWNAATGGRVEFVRDQSAADSEILVIGTGNLRAVGSQSERNGVLAMGSGRAATGEDYVVSGVAWMDRAEAWDTSYGVDGSSRFDFFTVTAHEIGHVLGYQDSFDYSQPNIMLGSYGGELTFESIVNVVSTDTPALHQDGELSFSPMTSAQLKASEVESILTSASTLTASDDAIIAVVDRNGRILGVRVEDGVRDAGGGVPDDATLSFMIDGALAKARTAAFFANGDPTNGDREGTLAPLTSRTVRFVSQSTVTQREVESNPNAADPTLRGPGFVAPIGLGGHFPPETPRTPHVDLFAIEHTNRDRFDHTRAGGRKKNRFNAPFDSNAKRIFAPKSYGQVTGIAKKQKPRGIGTLPGGVPIYADTNMDGVGDTLVGGVGVFFPGPDGFATHEQGFVPGIGQTEKERTNAPKVLEAELMAAIAAGGSVLGAAASKRPVLAQTGDRFDIPFSEGLTLVGINLEVIGPTASDKGLRQLVKFAEELAESTGTPLGTAVDSGMNVPVRRNGVTTVIDGKRVPQFDLVSPRDAVAGTLTEADVETIFTQADAAARRVRAAIRLEVIDDTIDSVRDIRGGISQTRMVFAVTDLEGNVIGLHRMQDATVFSIDVAVAKARNVTYYAGAGLDARDKVDGVPAETAFTNRTFRFLAEPRFPSGVDGSDPPPFSILNNPFIDAETAENTGAARSFKKYRDTVLGYDAFVPGTNFRDADTLRKNQNGIVFFPGSVPLYKDGRLVGGLGISGDGVDQDDVVTFLGAQGYLPYDVVPVADEFHVSGVRLPFIKFLRNPFLDP